MMRNMCGVRAHPSRIVALVLLVGIIVVTREYMAQSSADKPVREFESYRNRERGTGESKSNSQLLSNLKPSYNLHPSPIPRASSKLQPLKPVTGSRHQKWIVLTSINPPTEAVKSLAQLKGWQLLVVGDTKTPKDWSWPGVIFLDYETQLDMGYSIVNHIAPKSYPRKTFGYLYAIQHGAEIIYETDDDNVPWPKLDLSSFVTESTYTGLIVNNHGPFNHHVHFGQSSTWPRGFPLASISANQSREYFVDTIRTPSVQQGLVNGDPDMDAIYRLTRKHKDINLNITFDPMSPPLVMPYRSISPYNSQNTLFHYRAFWSLPLPVSVSFRVTDIWRSYWAQPLMWLLGERMLYLPPNAFQERNAHNYVKDAFDEFQMYRQSDEFVKFLLRWKCDETDFAKCAVKLSYDMVEKKFWGEKDAVFIESWFNDLRAIGYTMPEISNVPLGRDNEKVIYYPVEQDSSFPNSMKNQKLESDDTALILEDALLKTCPSASLNMLNSLMQINPIFPDVLLVIFIQKGKTGSIPMLDLKYKPHFPSIVYCGLDFDGRQKSKTIKNSYISVKELDSKGDNTARTQCITTALRMNYGVRGYLFIVDEVILHVQLLRGLDRNSFWYSMSNVQSAVNVGGLNMATENKFSRETEKVDFEKCTTQYLKNTQTLKFQSVVPVQLFYIPRVSVSPGVHEYLHSGKVSDNMLQPFLLACAKKAVKPLALTATDQQAYFYLEKPLSKMFSANNLLCDVILPKFLWVANNM